MISFEEYIKKVEERIKKYIPPRSEWGPVEKALYGVKDIYGVDPKEARELRFKAIKFQFSRQYEQNRFYRKLCKSQNIAPDDIKTEDDFKKIPLLEDRFFKSYPEGRDFAFWIANIYTGDLPEIFINKRNPRIDDVLREFNRRGLKIFYSSGTSGRHTFIPRDKKTFNRTIYGAAKGFASMAYPNLDFERVRGYISLYAKNINLFAGIMGGMLFDLLEHVDYGIVLNIEVTTNMLRAAMRGRQNPIIRLASLYIDWRRTKKFVRWLKERHSNKDDIALLGAPFFLNHIMNLLEKKGMSFDFGERSFIVTGGGWKVRENVRITTKEFREKAERVLGIPQTNCLDAYGMVEGNGFAFHCPEGHYLHLPYSFYYPMIIGKDGEKIEYGETGRFAFLDALADSYPGFIISGDEVKLLEHCPVCDRPGPVLEPEIKRARGEEIRGCAEEVRRMLSIGSR